MVLVKSDKGLFCFRVEFCYVKVEKLSISVARLDATYNETEYDRNKIELCESIVLPAHKTPETIDHLLTKVLFFYPQYNLGILYAGG